MGDIDFPNKIKYKKLVPEAIAPYREKGNNGFDLCCVKDDQFYPKTDKAEASYWLGPGARHLFSTGLQIELPEKHFAMLRPRSGLANKFGLHVLGGLIDESYRGEWKVILLNTSKENLVIKPGDKIVQFVIIKDDDYELVEETELSETTRGEKGFGSSGT